MTCGILGWWVPCWPTMDLRLSRPNTSDCWRSPLATRPGPCGGGAVTYDIGLSLTLTAVLTPSLGQSFPDPRWFGFWVRHIFVVWAAVYLVWGLGMRPTWRLYRTTVIAVLGWAVVAYTFNVVMDTNYGYLVRTPAAATLLLTLWALVITLPWELATGRAYSRAGDGRLRT